jgi:hypothetical protein
MRKKRFVQAAASGLLLAVSISAAGCGKDTPAVGETTLPAVTSPAPSSSIAATVTVPPVASPDATGQEKLASATNNVQQAGTEVKSSPTESVKPKKVFDGYSVDKPLLMGIAIGEAADKTVKLHGNPASTYVMEDAEDPITVYEYDGFNVGYNAKKLVEFIEILKSDADPGLNGLRIGKTTADASKALGKPDSSTDYVMTYKTKETILKLDVDTKTKTIQSIKLFGRTE